MLYADTPPEELAEFPGFLLNYLGTKSSARFAATIAPLGFHPREFGVMTVISRRPGITQQELSELSRVDRSTMVAILDDLESRGLAERRAHATDRRKRAVHLTAKGDEARSKILDAARGLVDELFGRLTSDERVELARLLKKMAGFEA